ncbi:MAG: glucoamylase family protein [Nitrospira sp.]|nr:glucoamylase family protein [Nitrospira sp.]
MTRHTANYPNSPVGSEEMLDALQHHAFEYFLHRTNPKNGLVADRTKPDAPASIAAVGFALASYPVGVERAWITRAEAVKRTLAALRFFWKSPQGTSARATGYKGFYYHFLDMKTGRRAGKCELSTVDTGFLLAGMLAAATYFDQESADEQEIRTLADALYRRTNWQWARHGKATIIHGWKPESGFLKYRWEGYDEALLLYALGLGSPTYPLPKESYSAWISSYEWKKIYGHEYLYGSSLFIHQYSHMWIDFRGIQDAFMRGKGIDYFENSRRATHVQQQYAVHNPFEFVGYSQYFWGLTATDGPGWTVRKVKGVERSFFDYAARGVPYGPDDGTIAPWAVVASLPFAPEIVLPTVLNFQKVYPQVMGRYCFKCSFNLTFPHKAHGRLGWNSPYHYGINAGPVVLMCENFRSELLWRLTKRCPYIVTGLRRAGFVNGWL